MNKLITWFEIPVLDLSRARAFYEQVFGVTLLDGSPTFPLMLIFPYDREQATGGCLVTAEVRQPSRDGIGIYLNAGDSLDETLGRVETAGGSVVVPKTALPPPMGFVAHISDLDGNRIGLHAMK